MQRWLRTAAVGIATGALTVSAAWAGAGLAPVAVEEAVEDVTEDVGEVADPDDDTDGGEDEASEPVDAADPTPDPAPVSADLAGGQILAGAAKVSMEPRPDDYDGEWQTEGCETLGDDAGEETIHQLPDTSRSPWPSSPDCIYMGGYGIGPMNAITSWDDEHGLWIRTVALSDGGETVVLTMIDSVYYFAEYSSMCETCGAFQIADRLGAELGIDPAGFFLIANHSHTSPDLIGGWGGVPEWYMTQIEESLEESIRTAVSGMQPATLEVGEVLARAHNRERRNTYRSAEEPAVSWFRVVADADEPGDSGGARDIDGDVIATVGAFAAHPTTVSPDEGVAHADWPGVFATTVEERFGGIGMNVPTGLGNMSTAGGTQMGAELAALVPEVGAGSTVEGPTVRVAAERWRHPVTNTVLGAIATPGFFDRPFEPVPSEVSVGTHDVARCVSASAVSVTTGVSAARIGSLVITGAPGETFSNLSNTIKEANPNGVTLPLGMTNDGLGYLMQSFESDTLARQGFGFGAQDAGAEYEEAYSIDECIGDKALETTLELLAELGG
jgi:hypothetical protein